MKVLELKPLKDKNLKLILIESEFPIDWALELPKSDIDILGEIFFVSKEYINFIENLTEKYHPYFVVEDMGMRSNNIVSPEDEFGEIFRKRGIPYSYVNIPDYALNIISAPLIDKKAFIEKFSEEIERYKSMGRVHYNDPHFQQLVIWKQFLKEEYKMEEDEIRYKIRESWMMMAILELAKNQKNKNLRAFFICDKTHFDGIVFLASELDIETEVINIKKEPKNFDEVNSIKDILNKSVIDIMPIKVKKKEKQEKILYFFDTDEYCSPFDTNMGYDAGFDVVLPYCKMTSDRVVKLVQDALFSRKVGAPTVFFIGGSNIAESEKIAENVLNSLVPPFEVPIIIDPRGAHTTAAAIVSKTIEVAQFHGISNLSKTKIVILGGTGPVGQIAALIASKLNAKVIITSRREEYVKNLARNLTEKASNSAGQIVGMVANSEDDYYKIIKEADIIWSVGKAGVQMVSTNTVKKLNSTKILVDINLVPPYGVEGMKPEYNNKEISPGIFGIGALGIGQIKYKIEREIFKEAAITKGKKIFDYNIAFEFANKIVLGEEIKIEL